MSIDVFAPAHCIAEKVRSGDYTATSVVKAFLDRILRFNPQVNAFTDVLGDRAFAQARAIDAARARGEDIGPLAGVPVAAKNLFDIAGIPTRAGSKINRERARANRDAVLIERLTAAGAILLGGLNMGEYAYDFTGENVHDGSCRNPHDLSRMTGGSSSGSGAATAAGFAPVSLGSDTNGSIRVPSSLCGIFGLKPTYGRLPRTRSFPFCDALDHLGPLARTVTDLSLAYDAMQGPDSDDPVCAQLPIEATVSVLGEGVQNLRVAIADGHFSAAGMPDAAHAVEVVSTALGAIRKLTLEGAAIARAAAFIITNVESSAFHMQRLRERADDFDPDTRDRFLAGAMLPASWYIDAQRARRWFHDEMMKVFEDVDLIVAPATPTTAPHLGQRTLDIRGESVLLRPNLGLFTQPISCIGLPVVTVPVFSGRLPIGVQLIAPPWREDLCLRAAYALEREGIVTARSPEL